MSLRVVRIAAGSALQDSGRHGFRRFGVPPGGAFDREAHLLANALLGNAPEAAVLEIALLGGVFEAIASIPVAIVGAASGIEIDGKGAPPNAAVTLEPGQTIAVDPSTPGVRAYLAIAGGIAGQPVLGSLSGIPVEKESVLSPGKICADHRPITKRLAEPPGSLALGAIRVLPGPHAPLFDLSNLRGAEFEVSRDSSRLGLRFEGPSLGEGKELPSEPMCVGAVQVAPGGQILAIGPDGPTVGGYPKAMVVIEADLDRLAQLRPGDRVRLELIDLAVAERLAASRSARIEALLRALKVSSM